MGSRSLRLRYPSSFFPPIFARLLLVLDELSWRFKNRPFRGFRIICYGFDKTTATILDFTVTTTMESLMDVRLSLSS